jgi:sterol desaturase/sphingolipid hydroxylase (fatty acid hydroxylase superfamily)
MEAIAQFMGHVIGYDIWFYVSHVALHSRYLWWIHRTHHEKREPKWIDTYHGHWLESPFQGVGFLLPWIGPTPNLWIAAAALVFINVRAMLHHDRRGTWLVGDYHLIHHRRPGVNYGQPWLDWLGGTAAT